MTKLPTPKAEGDKMTCPDCGLPIVARLKSYKDNVYTAYVQWQNEKETKAHKTKDGDCKGVTPKEEPKSKLGLDTALATTPKKELETLDVSTKKTGIIKLRNQNKKFQKFLENLKQPQFNSDPLIILLQKLVEDSYKDKEIIFELHQKIENLELDINNLKAQRYDEK